jgi:phosphoserine phosphatase
MNAIITDYDYTLSDKFMTVELLSLLEKLKITIPGYKKEYTNLKKLYDSGEMQYNDFVDGDMHFIKKYLKGVKYTDLLKVLREDFEPEKNIFGWAKEIRNVFNEDNWMFIIVSSTMGTCLEGVQDVLNFDTYLASSYEIKNQKFTGEFSCQVKSEQKGQYVAALKNSFEKTIVVGDAPGDFGMMKFADKAFLFEPKESTLKITEDLDFEILDRNNALERLKKEI